MRRAFPSGMLHRRQLLTALFATAALAASGDALAAPPATTPAEVPDTLTAFVQTVCPLPSPTTVDAVATLTSRDLPFAKVVKLLTFDLNLRSRHRFHAPFAELTPAQRAEVVHAGLTADSIVHRVYAGAVYVAQIGYYAGARSPQTGCPAIGFPGAYRFDGYASITFSDPGAWMASAQTDDGNPA